MSYEATPSLYGTAPAPGERSFDAPEARMLGYEDAVVMDLGLPIEQSEAFGLKTRIEDESGHTNIVVSGLFTKGGEPVETATGRGQAGSDESYIVFSAQRTDADGRLTTDTFVSRVVPSEDGKTMQPDLTPKGERAIWQITPGKKHTVRSANGQEELFDVSLMGAAGARVQSVTRDPLETFMHEQIKADRATAHATVPMVHEGPAAEEPAAMEEYADQGGAEQPAPAPVAEPISAAASAPGAEAITPERTRESVFASIDTLREALQSGDRNVEDTVLKFLAVRRAAATDAAWERLVEPKLESLYGNPEVAAARQELAEARQMIDSVANLHQAAIDMSNYNPRSAEDMHYLAQAVAVTAQRAGFTDGALSWDRTMLERRMDTLAGMRDLLGLDRTIIEDSDVTIAITNEHSVLAGLRFARKMHDEQQDLLLTEILTGIQAAPKGPDDDGSWARLQDALGSRTYDITKSSVMHGMRNLAGWVSEGSMQQMLGELGRAYDDTELALWMQIVRILSGDTQTDPESGQKLFYGTSFVVGGAYKDIVGSMTYVLDNLSAAAARRQQGV